MSHARVAVLQVVSKQLSVTAAAAEYGFSRRHLQRLLARYREGGLDALQPRSRRPKTTAIATPEDVRRRVLELRSQLTSDGLDAGPVTIGWHLEREGLRAPSTSTIRRILRQAGLITPEPRKRPRSSYTRFEMAQPNEMRQSDFIHLRLADGTEVEILNRLDDHSRYLLSCTVHRPVRGDDVVAVFLAAIDDHGPPASTLTELQRWLRARPPASSTAQLQRQLDQFREHYNEQRPHRALHRSTPGDAYHATPKAAPTTNGHDQAHYRLRYDRLDTKGKMSIRRAGRMHHLGVGTDHARKRVLALADEHHITVIELDTGEVLSTHQIEPDKTYWRNQNKKPGRWPSSPN